MAELTPEQAMRLLHTLSAKLEQQSEIQLDPSISFISFLFADVALIATLLADYIERLDRLQAEVWRIDAEQKGMAVDLSEKKAFMEGFQEGRPE